MSPYDPKPYDTNAYMLTAVFCEFTAIFKQQQDLFSDCVKILALTSLSFFSAHRAEQLDPG